MTDADADPDAESAQRGTEPIVPPVITTPAGSAAVEQTEQGTGPAPTLVESFEGLGNGFTGPQGDFRGNNPSDNSLAVGPNHIVQIVNSRTAIYTKKGKKFDTTGKVLYGPVITNNVFKGFGGTCENDEQRRRRGALRPARRPLADRRADLQAGGGEAGSAGRMERRSAAPT